jgi:hypothetical protein
MSGGRTPTHLSRRRRISRREENNMTTEQINERIEKLEKERTELTTAHDETMQQLQQVILTNRGRFQWLTGAIDELKLQLNGESEVTVSSVTMTTPEKDK